MDNNQQKVGQMGSDIGTTMAPLANPVMQGVDAISPVIEYLLQMLGQQKQPAPSTTSQQVGPYRGPVANPQQGGAPLKQQIMGR